MTDTKREPLIHITRRSEKIAMPWWQKWAIRIGAVLIAVVIIALATYLLFDLSPIKLFSTIFKGAFVGNIRIVATIKSTCKLLLLAVALAPAFKMKFWNIGAEGQMLVGAVAAAFIMHDFPNLPNWLIVILMCIASMIAGAVWALLPAFFKSKFNTNETLFTLMMNYIAINIVNLCASIWKGNQTKLGTINGDPLATTYQKGWFAQNLWDSSSMPLGISSQDFMFILVILVIAVLMFFYLKYTKQGYEISVVGDSSNTARYAGISVSKVMLRTLIISGLICGVCGFLTVSTQSHTISTTMTNGYGFTAIIVAWMSKFNTLSMAGISLLVVALENGAKTVFDTYNSTLGFPESASSIIVGLILLFIVGSEFFINYNVHFRKKSKTKEAK